MGARFAIEIQKAFVIASPHWGITRRMLFMSISSVSSASASPPVKAPEVSAAPAPPVKRDTDDTNSSQPVQAPLPPGQGTRVNQLV